MTKALELNLAFRNILKTAKTMDEATLLYHNAIAEIYPFDYELESADLQREWDWKAEREREVKGA